MGQLQASYKDTYQANLGTVNGGYTTSSRPCDNCGRRGEDGVYSSFGLGFKDAGVNWKREHTTDDHCTDAYGRKDGEK